MSDREKSRLNLGLDGDVLCWAVSTSADLEVARFDVAGDLVETRADVASLPGGDARVEDIVHFLECLTLGLGSSQEHVDEGDSVEGAEDLMHVLALDYSSSERG